MNIRYLDLSIPEEKRPTYLKEIEKIFTSGQYQLGENVRGIETEFANYIGIKHAVSMSNATQALHLAMILLGVGEGDEVITVANTSICTVFPIIYQKANAVFVDINPNTFNIDPNLIEAAITKKTKAITVVHLCGNPCDMDPILAVAKKHGLPVVEDVAHAPGGTYKGKKLGTLGTISCFSFFPSKNLGAGGDAGLLATNDDALAKKAFSLRNIGESDVKNMHAYVGYNYRMDEMQAAILRLGLPELDAKNARRRAIAHRYNEELGTLGQFIQEDPNGMCVYHLCPMLVENRNQVHEKLIAKGIPNGLQCSIPLYKQPCFESLFPNLSLKHTESFARRILTLPVDPKLKDEQVAHIIKTVREVLS